MGCFSRPAGDTAVLDPSVRRTSLRLERMLQEDTANVNQKTKLLLLGAGESGKSTVFKQVRIINANGYSESELKQFRYIIHRNVLDGIKTLVEETQTRGIDMKEANDDLADQVLLWDGENLNPEMAEVVARLWADDGIQKCFAMRAEFHLGDGVQYFMHHVKRVGELGYTPTTEDALHARVRTSGVVSKEFEIEGKPFQIFDVGGQRSERRKWLPLFDHVGVVVFVAAISEYDQVVPEDRSKNRMQESLDLFKQIVNSHHFAKANIILFLNKKDLFEEKIKRVDPKQCGFPDYTGGCNYEAAEAYFKNQFESRIDNPSKTLYSYTTCATDTNNIKVVLTSIQMMIFSAVYDSFGAQ